MKKKSEMGGNTSPFDALFSETGLDPSEAVRKTARPDLPKRFWKIVSLDQRDEGYFLLLDGRSARTPAGNPLYSVSESIAKTLQAEWADLEDIIDPERLPMTRLVNVARDTDPATRDDILNSVRAYAETDLLCYRADGPQRLAYRQNIVWTPYLDRLKTHHNIKLRLSSGIMPVAQDADQLDAIRTLAASRSCNMEVLIALHLATSLLGSAVLALALTEPGEDQLRAKIVWQAANVDEDWNRAQWGEDEESALRREARWRDFAAAAFVLSVSRC